MLSNRSTEKMRKRMLKTFKGSHLEYNEILSSSVWQKNVLILELLYKNKKMCVHNIVYYIKQINHSNYRLV